MYYDNRPLQSYNAIFNLSVTVRSKGKTWSHKIPACIRFLKHGYKVVWLRYFKKDVKEMMSKDFYSKKLIQKINEELNKNQSKIKWNLTRDNFKQDGKFVYFRKSKKNKWRWFIAVHCLSDEQALKSADDPDINRIVFDEYRLTPEKMSRYRGNPVPRRPNACCPRRHHDDRTAEHLRQPPGILSDLLCRGICHRAGGGLALRQSGL